MKIIANTLEILLDGGYKNFTEKEVKSAIEKQIPKKPYLKDLWELGTMQGVACPNCDTIFITAGEKYCKHCGQALDWSDTE